MSISFLPFGSVIVCWEAHAQSVICAPHTQTVGARVPCITTTHCAPTPANQLIIIISSIVNNTGRVSNRDDASQHNRGTRSFPFIARYINAVQDYQFAHQALTTVNRLFEPCFCIVNAGALPPTSCWHMRDTHDECLGHGYEYSF